MNILPRQGKSRDRVDKLGERPAVHPREPNELDEGIHGIEARMELRADEPSASVAGKLDLPILGHGHERANIRPGADQPTPVTRHHLIERLRSGHWDRDGGGFRMSRMEPGEDGGQGIVVYDPAKVAHEGQPDRAPYQA
jgi:hypothetical protein